LFRTRTNRVHAVEDAIKSLFITGFSKQDSELPGEFPCLRVYMYAIAL